MTRGTAWWSLVAWGFLASGLFAQRPGTTVQLPTYSFFSTATTVSVPDRGSAYLGGVKRAATGRNEFGVPLLPFRPFRNTAIGRELSASNVHVTATVHDFAAMDEYLLSQPTAFSWARPPGGPRAAAAAFGKTLQPRSPVQEGGWAVTSSANEDRLRASLRTLAEARARRESREAMRTAEALDFFERGKKAQAAGKSGAARIYYQMAARRATGEMRQLVRARLEAIGRSQTASAVADTRP